MKATIEIAGEIRSEAEKAFQFYDGAKIVWLPKSQVVWDQDAKTMEMEEWLAIEKGLV